MKSNIYIENNRYERGEMMTYIDKAKIFKAFCDETRIEILMKLTHGEKCACDLLEELKISQSTLSHHMKILCDSGIVEGTRQGKWVHYSINDKGIDLAKDILQGFKLSAD